MIHGTFLQGQKTQGLKLFLLVFLLTVVGLLKAQNTTQTISLNLKNVSLKEFFKQIESKTPFSILYRDVLLDNKNDISINVNNKPLNEILTSVLSSKGLTATFENNTIVITKLQVKSKAIASEPIKISGQVVDEKGEPIIGATIKIENSNVGTITNTNGEFIIDAHVGDRLIISYVGYEAKNITINEKTNNYKIVLTENAKILDEVVVIGYGTQRKVNLTGAVSMLTSEELNSRPIANVSSGLQGLLSGVTVVNISGQPGVNSSNIRIRGLGTIGNANPLVLIDGVEGDMNTLNPEDIESISVLKDAASASIYGARGANGVILVATKKLMTRDQPPTISLNAYYGTQSPTRLPEMCDAIEFMTLDNEARTNVGTAIAWNESHFEKVRNNTDPNHFGNTDWISAVLNNNAPQQNYSLNINGNVGQSGYLISYRYLDQQGLTVGNSTGEKRNNLRFKINSKLFDRVEINTNIGYTLQNIIAPAGSSTTNAGAISALYKAMRIAPNVPIFFTDGSWAYGGGNTNPVAILYDGGKTTYNAEELSLMGIAKINLIKGWDISATYSIVNKNALTNTLKKKIVFANPEEPETPVYIYNNPNSLNINNGKQRQQTLIVQTDFEFAIQQHKISGVLGFSQEWSDYQEFEASRINLLTEKNPSLNLGSKEGMSNNADYSSWAIRSGFGRLNYNYSDRYLAEFNMRYDLSSRFYKSQRGGLFPSFSLGWRLTEEPFMSFSEGYLDNIKLRGSWGKLGNQYVGSSNYPYLSVLTEVTGLSAIGTFGTSGYTQTILSNPHLTWEKINMLDLGIDIAILKNRLNVTFDWYNKNTNGILLKLNYPAQIGATPSEQNAGSVNNKGWDIEISWRDKIDKVKYGVTYNLSDVKNKITDLGGTAPDLSSYQIRQVGYPIGAFYGYIAEGLMTPDDFKLYDETEKKYYNPKIPVVVGPDYQPGDIKYKDISGPQGKPDGRITPEYDRVVIGNPIPRYLYSFKGDLAYRNVDFSFAFQGVGKADGYLTGSARHAFQDMAGYPQKIHLQRYNIVSNPNPNANYPRLTYNTSFNQSTFSTYWLEDASYLRLKNIQLGYSVPKKIINKARIANCRVYASAENLFTITNFFYAYDPETPVASNGGYYPQVKTFVVGLNLVFQ